MLSFEVTFIASLCLIGLTNIAEACINTAVTLDDPFPTFVGTSNATRMCGANQSARKPISVLTTVTYDNSEYAVGPLCTKSMEVALDRLRSSGNWLPNYDLVLELVNDQYNESVELKFLANQLQTTHENKARLPIFTTDNFSPVSQGISALMVKDFGFISVRF